MKRIKLSKWTSVFLAFSMLLMLSACGGADSMGYAEDSKNESYDSSMEYEKPAEDAIENTGSIELGQNESVQTNRKLIFNYNATLQTLEFDKTIDSIEKAVVSSGGYIESSSQSGSGAIDYGRVYPRSARYTLRIPAGKAQNFVESLASVATVVDSSQGLEDVTEYYYDSEARIKTLRVQEERLLELLAGADNISDMITIEQKLAEVRYEIESIDGTLRRLDSEIEYSRVDLYIDEVFEPEKLQAAPLTLGERISARFSRSISDIKATGEDMIVWLLGDSLLIIFWGAIIGGLVFAGNYTYKFFRKKREEKYFGGPKDTDNK